MQDRANQRSQKPIRAEYIELAIRVRISDTWNASPERNLQRYRRNEIYERPSASRALGILVGVVFLYGAPADEIQKAEESGQAEDDAGVDKLAV